MTFYLYRKDDARPDVTDHALDLRLFPGWRLMAESADRPRVGGMIFDGDDKLIPDRDEPAYVTQRRQAYPRIAEQLDALWKHLGAAADDGLELGPEAAAMLCRVRGVKARFPKK